MSRLFDGPHHQVIALQLLAWALLWMGACLIGLWRAREERWRAFWFMSGIWGWIDALIALGGLLGSPPEPAMLRRILFINAGLDVVYLITGLALASRSRPLLRGFGVAILIQGGFLLLFDLLHGLAISA